VADRIFVVRQSAFEGRKIVRAHQMNRGLFHGGMIEGLVDMPDIESIKRRPLRPVQNPVFVKFPTGGVARVKIVRNKIR
jgi:hypothetical protein